MATNSLDLLYSQIDVCQTFSPAPTMSAPETAMHSTQLHGLLSELVAAQNRQTAMLEELIANITHPQRRKIIELGMWKQSNPELAEYCKRAAKKLERIQTDLLSTITEEIDSNDDMLFESEYGLNEFIGRYGSKFLQLNSLLQILAQLGNAPDIQVATQEVRRNP